jgi:hypothetical protein
MSVLQNFIPKFSLAGFTVKLALMPLCKPTPESLIV